MKILRNFEGIFIDQSLYIEKRLKICNYFDCKPTCSPFVPRVSLLLTKSNSNVINQDKHTRIIICLRYSTDCTRPDIVFAIGVLSRSLVNQILNIEILLIYL